MKKLMILFASAAMLFAGCAKEKFSIAECDGVLTDVTFSAVMQSAGSKAVADNDGMAANVNRCILEVYYGDALFTRMYAPVNSQKKASFTLQLVSNRTYKLAFWADCVDDPSGEVGIATDKYYTTNAEGGLQAVALKGTYLGNDDARDAFAFSGDYTVEQGGSSFDVTLTRPFAQINVITTDVATVKKVTSAKPEKVDVTIKNAVAKYNVLAGTAVENSTADLNYEASLYNWDATKSECTLSMDYIFAENEKAVVDIDWKAKKTNNADVAHSFTSVPYQRNYRTNIKGALLTTTGKWNVTVDPIWETPDQKHDVVNDIKSLNELLASSSVTGQTTLDIETTMPNDSDSQNVNFTSNNNGQAIKLTFSGELGAGKTLTLQASGSSANGPDVVDITAPAGTNITSNLENTHFIINGTSYGTISGSFSANSLVISKGVEVEIISIAQGGLEIHGTVGAVDIPTPHGNIYVRDCEGLSQAVYTVLEPYIDIDNGYAGVKKGEDNYDIVAGAAPYVAQIGENKYYSIAAAFAAVQEGQTIQMLTNAVVGAQYTITNALALTTSGVTLDLNEKTITVTNNFSFIIGADNITVKNGNIYSAYAEEKASKHISYTLTVAAIGTGVKLTGIKLEDLNFTGGVRFGGATTAQYKGAANGTITNCNIESGDYYDVYATYGSIVNIESGTFFSIHENNEECIVSGNEASFVLTGGVFDRNYNNHLSSYLAPGYKVSQTSEDPERWQVEAKCAAVIGDTEYSSLTDALDAVKDGDVIKVLKDATTKDRIRLVGKKFTIDWGNSTLTKTGTATCSVFQFSGCDITMKGKNGGIVCDGRSTTESLFTFDGSKENRITIDGGHYVNTYGDTNSSSKVSLIYPIIDSNTYITINGGTLELVCTSTSASKVQGNHSIIYGLNDGYNKAPYLKITGGHLITRLTCPDIKGSDVASKMYNIWYQGKEKVEITGGTFESAGTCIQLRFSSFGENNLLIDGEDVLFKNSYSALHFNKVTYNSGAFTVGSFKSRNCTYGLKTSGAQTVAVTGADIADCSYGAYNYSSSTVTITGNSKIAGSEYGFKNDSGSTATIKEGCITGIVEGEVSYID